MPQAIGIVVVHYGDPRPTRSCLKSIVHDGPAELRRVVVVDNSGEMAQEDLGPDVVRVSCPENPGFGGGANHGVERLEEEGACAGYVVLNHDVELLDGYLEAAAGALARGAAAAAGPIYHDRSARRLWYAGGEVNLWTGTVHQSRAPRDAAREHEVGFLPGAALLVSAAAWREAGGFDPAFFLYNEDVDLSLRLRHLGFSLRFVPGMRVVHQLGAATGSDRLSSLYLEHLTRTRLRPFPSRSHRLYLAVLHTGWVCVRSGLLGLRHGLGASAQVRALLRGHRAALHDVLVRP